MRKKKREYAVLAITKLVAVMRSQAADGWSDAAFSGGGAALIAVIVPVGLSGWSWRRTGAFRRRPQA